MTEPSTPTTGADDLAQEFVALNARLGAGGDGPDALQRLVALAQRAVPGCDWAGVTAWPGRRAPYSLAVTGSVAQEADQLQYDLGDGPCLAAAADSEVVHVPDLTAEDRWPAFTAAALERTPVRGLMSFHLTETPTLTALNLYGGTPSAFTDEALSIGALFAAHARVLLMHVDSAQRAANLSVALATSRQIGAAVGILMSAHKVTADHAFELLKTSSQRLDRKLREIAVEVTETGALPDGG